MRDSAAAFPLGTYLFLRHVTFLESVSIDNRQVRLEHRRLKVLVLLHTPNAFHMSCQIVSSWLIEVCGFGNSELLQRCQRAAGGHAGQRRTLEELCAQAAKDQDAAKLRKLAVEVTNSSLRINVLQT